jgi:hypothetical protein
MSPGELSVLPVHPAATHLIALRPAAFSPSFSHRLAFHYATLSDYANKLKVLGYLTRWLRPASAVSALFFSPPTILE